MIKHFKQTQCKFSVAYKKTSRNLYIKYFKIAKPIYHVRLKKEENLKCGVYLYGIFRWRTQYIKGELQKKNA